MNRAAGQLQISAAHRLELLAPGIRERGFARIGQHDRPSIAACNIV